MVQPAAVDLDRLTEPISFLTIEKMERIDEALAQILDLKSTSVCMS